MTVKVCMLTVVHVESVSSAGQLVHLVNSPWHQTPLLVVGFAATHAVCFTSSCLTISQYGSIAAVQSCFDDVISTCLKAQAQLNCLCRSHCALPKPRCIARACEQERLAAVSGCSPAPYLEYILLASILKYIVKRELHHMYM